MKWHLFFICAYAILLAACVGEEYQCAAQLNDEVRQAYIRMDYEQADSLAAEAVRHGGNSAQAVRAHLWQMRIAQRVSDDARFYTHLLAVDRIMSDWAQPYNATQRMCASELHVVLSTYLYYMRDDTNSRDEILKAQPYIMSEDTLARTSYLYNLSAGGSTLTDFDNLLSCYLEARQCGSDYFMANALQSLAVVMNDSVRVDSLRSLRPGGVAMLQAIGTPDSIASLALDIFSQRGDVYQSACVMRTMGELAFSRADYETALRHFLHSLDIASDPSHPSVPLLVGDVHEWLSKTYAALGMIAQSDSHRDAYLGLLEVTRQDHEYEGRISTLHHETRVAWTQMGIVVVLAVLLALMIWFFSHHMRKNDEAETATLNDALLAANLKRQMNDERDELADAIRLVRQRLVDGKRQAVEHRAKVAYVMAIMPLVDRLVDALRRGSIDYARELLDGIMHRNNRLTEWIQMRRGRLSLHIKRFDVTQLFDIVSGTASSLSQQGITLAVERADQPIMVQADRTLTLFMLNTLVDNARRYTPEGGTITLEARRDDDAVEIAVSDTGCGMTQQQVDDLMERKFAPQTDDQHHGFGLLNCRGVIENYRKMGRRFAVCRFGITSRVGEGSRFFFRLPLACMMMFVMSVTAAWATPSVTVTDSVHIMNVQGQYDEALRCAEQAICRLNPTGRDDVQLWNDSAKISFDQLLSLRNEAAIAALALHDMKAYARHNGNYVRLFKKVNSDPTLVSYCARLERTYATQRLLMWVTLIAAVLAVGLLVVLVVRSRLRYKRVLDDLREQVNALRRQSEYEEQTLHVQNEILDNCLSTIKHETMYYPARLKQMINVSTTYDIGAATSDATQIQNEVLPLALTYREVFSALAAQAADALHRKGYKRQSVVFLGQRMMGDPDLVVYFDELIEDRSQLKNIDFSDDNATVPHLIAKQIVRDHDDMNNHPGLKLESRE